MDFERYIKSKIQICIYTDFYLIDSKTPNRTATNLEVLKNRL